MSALPPPAASSDPTPDGAGRGGASPGGSSPGDGAQDGSVQHGSAKDGTAAPLQPTELVDTVEQPGKVLRIGSMIKQLLDEVRQAPLDSASRVRMKDIYETSVRELAAGLSPDLSAELDRLALPFESSIPSDAELRVAQAQLVGWLEGLFHGIQATLFAQQMAARSQLEEMRQQALGPGGAGSRPDPGPRTGSYL